MNKWIVQFQQASGRDPWVWPIIPRVTLFVSIAILTVVLLWFLWLSGMRDELDSARNAEASLRQEFSKDYRKVVNLESLMKQKEQIVEYVNLLEKQLPSQAEMAALLSDINQAGVGRGLQFETFKPGAPQVKQYYAEQPIQILVSGSFDAVSNFVADLAGLSRIVTIGDMELAKIKKEDEAISMKASIKTYRYLSAEEQQSKGGAKGNAKGKK